MEIKKSKTGNMLRVDPEFAQYVEKQYRELNSDFNAIGKKITKTQITKLILEDHKLFRSGKRKEYFSLFK